jgi:membrane dipeptidase
MTNVFTGPSSILSKMIGYSGKSFLYDKKTAEIKQNDFEKIKDTAFKGGFFEIFIPPVEKLELKKTVNGFEADYPASLNFDYALISYLRHCASVLRNDYVSKNCINWVRKPMDLDVSENDRRIMMVLHLADADAIDEEMDMLDIFYALGVRSIAITWSRQNKFGYGSPYKFPGHPNVGSGLTKAGVNLIEKCNDLGIVIDTAHLNEAGFRDVAAHSSKPLVISHGTPHSLNPSSRTFTDDMLKMIASANGIVGISLEGVKESSSGYADDMFRHINYVVQKVGDNHVGFGSDMIVPGDEIKTLLPDIINLMASKGYSESTIDKIIFENWKRIFKSTL